MRPSSATVTVAAGPLCVVVFEDPPPLQPTALTARVAATITDDHV
jgi:hypothetical protein